jgi:hypothetical protein
LKLAGNSMDHLGLELTHLFLLGETESGDKAGQSAPDMASWMDQTTQGKQKHAR